MSVDVTVLNHGTIVQIIPRTLEVEQWLRDNCNAEPWAWSANTLCVEPRYVGAIIKGMRDQGFFGG
jgi:hypothetical protein